MINEYYVEFFIAVFFFCLVMFWLNKTRGWNSGRYYVPELLTLLLLCLISGTRYNMGGTDVYVYHYVYDAVSSPNDLLSHWDNKEYVGGPFNMERGYMLLISICRWSLSMDFWDFCLLHSIIFYTLTYIGLRKYLPNFNFFIFIFLYKLFFYNTCISMRQSLTVAIFFVAMRFIEERKPLKYYLCILPALFLHNGAYLLLLIYPIRFFKITRKRVVILCCIFLPLSIFSFMNVNVFGWAGPLVDLIDDPLVKEKTAAYTSSESPTAIGIFHMLEYFALMTFVIIQYKEIIKCPHAEFILKLLLILLPLFTLFRGLEILTREKDYFTFTYAVVLYYLANIKNGTYRIVTEWAMILVCAFGFFRFIYLFDFGHFMHYRSWLLDPVNTIQRYR